MKFPRTEIEKVCADSTEVRTYLQHAYLDTGKARLLASDGHMAVSLPVEVEDGDTDGAISVTALSAARRAAGKILDPQIKANGALSLPLAGVSFDRPTVPEGQAYPVGIIDKLAIGDMMSEITITLNAEKLHKLALALTDKGREPIVTVRLPAIEATGQPAIVKPTHGGTDGRTGLLMLCHGDGSLRANSDRIALMRRMVKCMANMHEALGQAGHPGDSALMVESLTLLTYAHKAVKPIGE